MNLMLPGLLNGSQITKTEDRLSCPRCELILRKPIEERMQETASGIIVRVPGDPYSKPTWIPRAKETGIVTTKDIKQTHHKNRPLIALPGDSTCCFKEDDTCKLSKLTCHCARKEV